MSNLSNIGSLISLHLDAIKIVEPTDVSEFLIEASAKLLNQSGGRNWIPLIVKEIEEGKYEAIANTFIYAVAEKAGLNRVWCIIVEDTNNAIESAKVLAREKMPKVNLCSASRDEIKAAMQYLIDKPGSALRSVNLAVATTRIDEASRQSWKNFNEIPKLRCGITKGKRLDSLKEVFYLAPQAIVHEPTPSNTNKEELKKIDADRLNKMTVTILKEEAKKMNLTVPTKVRKADLIEAILQA